MIRIAHAKENLETFVAASAVTSISRTSSSSNYSLRSIVRLTDGSVIESSDEALSLVMRVEEQLK